MDISEVPTKILSQPLMPLCASNCVFENLMDTAGSLQNNKIRCSQNVSFGVWNCRKLCIFKFLFCRVLGSLLLMGITAGRREDLCTGMLVNEFSLPLGPKQKLKRYIGPGFHKNDQICLPSCVYVSQICSSKSIQKALFLNQQVYLDRKHVS